MLATYGEKPNECWRNKVAAIYLVTTLSAKGHTARHGATQINELVNITEFYQNHILPELQNQDGKLQFLVCILFKDHIWKHRLSNSNINCSIVF